MGGVFPGHKKTNLSPLKKFLFIVGLILKINLMRIVIRCSPCRETPLKKGKIIIWHSNNPLQIMITVLQLKSKKLLIVIIFKSRTTKKNSKTKMMTFSKQMTKI